jgi:hypothetical protein
MWVFCPQGRASSTPQSPATTSPQSLEGRHTSQPLPHHPLDLLFALGPLFHDRFPFIKLLRRFQMKQQPIALIELFMFFRFQMK